MRRHLLTIALIISGSSGCDNVGWGGMDLTVLPPPVVVEPEPVVDESEVEVSVPVNIDYPVLLAGTRQGATASLVVVGEVDGAALQPFPAADAPEDVDRLARLTAPGAEWIVFSEGVRVGRLFAESSGAADGYCGDRAMVSGVVELVPTAAGATRLLALPAEAARDRPYSEYRELAHVYDQRVATLEMMQAAIPQYGATWPTQGVLDARKHIQAFAFDGAQGPFVAATFLFRDSLDVAPPGAGAYATFVMAEEITGVQQHVFTWHRAVDTEGKGAPRYFDHLDWDGDGDEEILLDVFGSNRRWFAGLGRLQGEWVRTFQDDCGSGSTTVD